MIALLLALFVGHAAFAGGDFVSSCSNQAKDKVVYGSTTGDPQDVGETAAAKAKAVFQAACTKCHGGGAGSGPIKDILDAADLRSIPGMIDTLEPEKSQLYQSIATGRMPLGADKLADADIEAVREWIAEGAPDFEGGGGNNGGGAIGAPFISYDQEVQCVLADLSANVDKRKAYYTRYVTLVPQWNAGDGIALDQLRQALDFALNSVSRQARLAKPVYIDKWHTIARIDLRDYRLEFEDWEKTLLPRYPYAFEPFENHFSFAQELKIEQLTGSARGWLRADWLVSEISQPPVYYDLLRMPKTAKELEENYLKLNAVDQFLEGKVLRAGIRSSGVANNNRFIDLFELEYGLGATQLSGPEFLYTKTYDFLDDVKNNNVLNAPFGPGIFFGKIIFPWLDKSRIFQHEASEMIFTLPNGLNGYYLADGQGNIQRAAPTTIAFDPLNQRPFIGEQPNEVVNGVSCMACHSSGLNPYADLVRNHVAGSAGFNNAEVQAIRELFPEQSAHNNAIRSFNASFQKTILQMGMPKVALTRRGAPVWVAVREYLSDNQLKAFGAELYLKEEEIQRAVFHAPKLARELGLTTAGTGVVSRDNLEKRYGEMLLEFAIGKQVVFKGKGGKPKKPPVKKPACRLSVKNDSQYSQHFDSFNFKGGAKVGSHRLAVGETRFYEHGQDAVVDGCWFFKDRHCVRQQRTLKACGSYRFARATDGRVYLFESK